MRYADTCLLLSLHLPDPGTPAALAWLEAAGRDQQEHALDHRAERHAGSIPAGGGTRNEIPGEGAHLFTAGRPC